MTWYRDSFGLDYLEIYSHRNQEQAGIEVDWVLRHLDLPPSSLILDVACGGGRHSLAFRNRGMRVVGVDLSLDLLRVGNKVVAPPNGIFVRGDMRDLPFRATFDAAVSLFTSFGYFESDADDRRVLRGIHRALRPEGKYLLDFLNREHVISNLVPRSEERRGEDWIMQERRLTPDRQRIEKTIRIRPGGSSEKERVFVESVRLYGRQELSDMLQGIGFRILGAFGAFADEAHTPGSPRLILIVQK